MDAMAEIKQTFFVECEDLLSDLESGLITLKNGEAHDDTIGSIFRAVHSIKGGAGAFDLTELVSFSHSFENVLDDLRSEVLQGDDNIYELLLESSDVLHDLVAAAQADDAWDPDRSAGLLLRLKELSSKDKAEAAATQASDETFGFQPVSLDAAESAPFDLTSISSQSSFDISFTPHKTMFGKGQSVTRLIRHLRELGDVVVECKCEDLPEFDALDPKEVYLSWHLSIVGDVIQDDIEEVFEFAIDDCDLTIQPGSALEPSLPALGLPELGTAESVLPSLSLPASPLPDLSLPDISTAEMTLPTIGSPELKVSPPTESIELPTLKIETSDKDKTDVSATPPKAQTDLKPPAVKKAPPPTIRINLERVDRLINQVGELVINQAMLTQSVMDAGLLKDPTVLSTLDEFKLLTRNIQDSVMAIRAQPVQPLFQRMSRIVREAAQATDKKAKLVMEGELTEVDKTIIEKLADPLTHMIRNAIDHGLETPEERVKIGKTAEGIVSLSAAHRSGKIVIEVSDDGAGINREKVKSLAVKKGLIAADAELTDNEIDNLLFMAGFSTVDTVSTLSGRGVGMDVVKRSIQSFGGRITIASAPGQGSTFTINLPLTLAVLDGMLVEVADQIIVIPLTSVVETLLPKPGDIHNVSPVDKVINVRDSFIPLINVERTLNFRSETRSKKNEIVLVVEAEDGTKSALLVDAIQDQRQVVIKSLEDNYGEVPYIAAATILGDGRIALIADIDELVKAPALAANTSSASTLKEAMPHSPTLKEAAYV